MSYPGDPFYTFRAHAFQIDQRTKRSWIPLSSDAVLIRISYDAASGFVNLASDPADGNTPGISSSLIAGTQITKTSSKFVQWLDRSGSVFGLGFANESDLNKFLGQYNSVWSSNAASSMPTPPPPPIPNTTSSNSTYPFPHPESNLGASMPPFSDQQKPIYAPSQPARSAPRPPAPPPQTPQPPPPIALKQPQAPPSAANYALLTNFQPGYNAPTDAAAPGFLDSKPNSTAVISNGTVLTSAPSPAPPPPPAGPPPAAIDQLTSEISNLRLENQQLRESVLTSNTNVKKWGEELSALRASNESSTHNAEQNARRAQCSLETLEALRALLLPGAHDSFWLEGGGAAGDGRHEWNAALVASMTKRAEELVSDEEQLRELPALKAETARLAALVEELRAQVTGSSEERSRELQQVLVKYTEIGHVIRSLTQEYNDLTMHLEELRRSRRSPQPLPRLPAPDAQSST